VSDTVLVIPSHARPTGPAERTIPALRSAGYFGPIDVWVNRKELPAYMPLDGVRLLPHDARPGLTYARNWIASSYDPGTRLVWADDDITEFVRGACEHKVVPATRLEDHIDYMFRLAGGALWGISANATPGWLKRSIVQSAGKYVAGSFYGYVVTGDVNEWLTVHGGDPEDGERTIRFNRKFGASYVATYLGIRTPAWGKAAGGMQSFRSLEDRVAGCRALCAAFPEELTFQEPRPDGRPRPPRMKRSPVRYFAEPGWESIMPPCDKCLGRANAAG
jgi:hypothetical protein